MFIISFASWGPLDGPHHWFSIGEARPSWGSPKSDRGGATHKERKK